MMEALHSNASPSSQVLDEWAKLIMAKWNRTLSQSGLRKKGRPALQHPGQRFNISAIADFVPRSNAQNFQFASHQIHT